MRAVIYLWVNLALLYAVNRFGLWRQMFGDAIIFLLWAWIIGGAVWASRSGPTRRATMPLSPHEADALQKAAQKASERADLSQGRGPV
jgi:hypothetical protein